MWANRYAVGSGWFTAELIETDDAGHAGRITLPQVAFGGNGTAMAVWEQSDGTRTNIWSNRYTPGVGWGSAQLIETDNAGGARGPSVAVDGAGNALAVWEQFDGTRSGRSGQVVLPRIAVDANGNAVAVWL